MVALLSADEGAAYEDVEEAAADGVVHPESGARFNVSSTLGEEHAADEAYDHEREPQDEGVDGGRGATCGAVDGCFAQPYKCEHNADADHTDGGAEDGCAVEAVGDVPEIFYVSFKLMINN